MTSDIPDVNHAGDFNKKFGTYDIEASDWNQIESIGLFDGNGCVLEDVQDHESQEDLVEFFCETMIQHPDVNIWYAHNGGKYDIKFFLDYLMENYYCEFIYANSSLIKVDVYEKGVENCYEDGQYKNSTPKNERLLCEFKDTLALFPMSLKGLTDSFDVNHKKQEYEDYENHEDREEMLEYLKYDCIGLWEVVADFMCRTNIPELKLTIASQSMQLYKERFGGNEFLSNLQANRSKEQYFRKGYFGGRTEVFKRYGQDLYYYDFHSMYPAVMKHKPYPAGKMLRTDEVKEDKLGIYKIKWTSPDTNIPLLPKKDSSGKLMFGTGEQIEGWYYSPEVKKAIEDGYDIEVVEGYYWTEQQYMFEDYINHWYSIKKESEGSMYLISKLFLNSLYGKFGQSREINEVETRPPSKEELVEQDWSVIDPDLGLYEREKELFTDYIYPYIAGFVTSYGRLKLYNALKKADNKGEVYYCDTDSLVVDHPIDTGPELGELGLESRVAEGYYLYPKVYAFKDYEGEVHIKSKGFKSDKLSYKDFEKAFEGDLSNFEQEWSGLVGFLEKYMRSETSKFTDKLVKKKSLNGTFDKRKLGDCKKDTQPIHLNECDLKQ